MKRLFDLSTAIVVILCILSWLLPVLALLIWLDSRGPAFFIQKRVGRHSRLFNCYKLRTMVVNDDADRRRVSADDGRITRFGEWLRNSHLDELPQFFNVLLGSMSLVGPRPYMPADCRVFRAMVDDADLRHRVRPGITGLAQSRGLHGVICDPDIVRQRYYWDAWYVEHADLMLDMRILARTLVSLLPRLRPVAEPSIRPAPVSPRG